MLQKFSASTIQCFKYLMLQGFNASQIQCFKSMIQNLRALKILRFKDSVFQSFEDSKIQIFEIRKIRKSQKNFYIPLALKFCFKPAKTH